MKRRIWLAGAGVAGVAGVGAAVYRVAPAFWRQFANEWQRDILPAPARPRPDQWPDRGLRAAWLGHATVLLKIDGYVVLTDPVLADYCGIHLGLVTLGLKRMVAPPLDLRALPKIDLILLSHAHMDHLDTASLRRLESKKTEVITAAGTSDLLRVERYARVRELRWGERAQAGPLAIRAIEVNHWGARMRTDTWRGYNGYVLDAGSRRVLFAGDTAETDSFRAVRASRAIDLAIMPIGAYNPWIRYHCTPEQAWRMGNDAGAEIFLPVHHQTFQLSREPVLEPIERFHAAARDSRRIAVSRIGGEWTA